MKKLVILIIVVILLAGGAWWYFNNQNTPSVPAAAPAALVPTEPVGPTTPPPAGTPNTVTIPVTGSTDSDLDQETAGIDTQMNGLNSDNASADSGLSSQ
jgi:hypothetical protein